MYGTTVYLVALALDLRVVLISRQNSTEHARPAGALGGKRAVSDKHLCDQVRGSSKMLL
jgi:hypothetical protein